MDVNKFIDSHKKEIATIQLSLSALMEIADPTISIRETALSSIRMELGYYKIYKTPSYLMAGLLIMYAYLGLCDCDHNTESVFEDLLSALKEEPSSLNANEIITEIPLKKRKLEQIINKWHPARDEMRKAEVIEDIMHKVSRNEKGTTYYTTSERNYRLVISDDGKYLYDLIFNVKYHFAD